MNLRIVFLGFCMMASGVAQSGAALKVVVTEGDGAINNVSSGRAKEPVVSVRDEQNRPVENAAVTFVAPRAGPGGLFPNGSAILTVTTDAEGRASGRGFRPNRIAGPFEIRVTASAQGRQGSATLRQTNAVVAQSGSGKKRAALLAIIGGAAAVGLAVAVGGGGSSPNSPGSVSTPPRSAVLVPGSPSIGAP